MHYVYIVFKNRKNFKLCLLTFNEVYIKIIFLYNEAASLLHEGGLPEA